MISHVTWNKILSPGHGFTKSPKMLAPESVPLPPLLIRVSHTGLLPLLKHTEPWPAQSSACVPWLGCTSPSFHVVNVLISPSPRQFHYRESCPYHPVWNSTPAYCPPILMPCILLLNTCYYWQIMSLFLYYLFHPLLCRNVLYPQWLGQCLTHQRQSVNDERCGISHLALALLPTSCPSRLEASQELGRLWTASEVMYF